ncbi:NEDD4-binding protein 2 isoform X1 [Denticeps clupeoides]|uniref:NEDD4-binding protein 2 isoform X1 n=1 Tax=Denticeps clupeoides TaxID=299321 RepID=UPI0010A423D7|nr:NEDD4-binding protein 2 isoform X1 [Denticeps clupeoides]
MPKKKKNGAVPVRAAGPADEFRSGSEGRGETGRDAGAAAAVPGSEEIVRKMEEMFSHLDPDVIYMVLAECEFKVENAMDSLLELAGAAEGAAPVRPPISGFEVAAALLDPKSAREAGPRLSGDTRNPVKRDSPTFHKTHTELSRKENPPGAIALSSLPLPQAPDPTAVLGSLSGQQQQTSSHRLTGACRGESPVDELSFGGGCIPEDKDKDRSLDFSHLMGGSLELGGAGSAFQTYRREEEPSSGATFSSEQGVVWNPQAPEFRPQSEGPSFITPIALNPTPAYPSYWFGYQPVSHAPLKPTATIPTSWTTKYPTSNNRLCLEGNVLVLLRGAPGSGKSTLARAMLKENPGGISLSTDDYFCRSGEYRYDPSELGTAHEWNHQRAEEALQRGQTPVIIDNTNMQSWEMKPYVAKALKYKYKVLFREPDTWWKHKPRELEKHTRHKVSREKIRRILDGYDRFVSVQSIMGSTRPDVNAQPSQVPSLPRPDLLGLRSTASLPDVSSVPAQTVVAGGDDSSPELFDGGELDRELEEATKLQEELVEFSQSIAQRKKRDGKHVDPESCQEQDEEGPQGDDSKAERSPLQFVGDWPFESLQPRDKRPKSQRDTNQGPGEPAFMVKNVGPDVTEFQKPLDLLRSSCEAEDQSGLIDSGEESQGEAWPPLPDCLTHTYTLHQSNSESEGEGCGHEEEDKREERGDSGQEHMVQNERMVNDRQNGREIKEEEKGEETEGTGGSHVAERRRPSRRSGKQCRLALTFTNQQPCSPTALLPESAPQQPESSAQSLPAKTAPLPGVYIQTEASDFALMWRLEHEGLWDCATVKVLMGNATHFIPRTSSDVIWCPSERVTHERGAQVDEPELMDSGIEDQGLKVLIHHFRAVPTETLQDLYEKCQQDLQWTTNLLLDSGEEMSREEEDCDSHREKKSLEGEGGDEEEREREPKGAEDEADEMEHRKEEDGVIRGNEMAGIITTEGVTNDSGHTVVKVSRSDEEAQVKDETSVDAEDSGSVNASDMQKELSPDPTSSSLSQLHWASDKDLAEQPDWDVLMEEAVEEVDGVPQFILAQLQERERKEEQERERSRREKEIERLRERSGERSTARLDIRTLELRLPTELALQLIELFGPVGVNPDDCSIQMDLNLARLLHQKWKETIQEKQLQEALSYQLLQETSPFVSMVTGSAQSGNSQADFARQQDSSQFQSGTNDCESLLGQSESHENIPFMDHWSVSVPHVSLRDIMTEEQALQEIEKSVLNHRDHERKDGAAVLKEKRLFSVFPSIDRLFLKDIFRDHNYNLEQTQQFLHSLLDEGPVRNVVAADTSPQRNNSTSKPRPHSKERQVHKLKDAALIYQDTEDPEYEDFRAEARLQRLKQQESFSKAAEAYRQGKKDVASFYAQQGHLHGQKMREANHRAAVQIFERVNASLLPQNVLDLHGLHVDEALQHLHQVLIDKTTEYQQGLCRPQLSIMTGRGNHSQGGVPRIRPAVIEYLTKQNYRFTEPTVGLILVSLHYN